LQWQLPDDTDKTGRDVWDYNGRPDPDYSDVSVGIVRGTPKSLALKVEKTIDFIIIFLLVS
jgi:hypothetical protein